MKTYFLLIVVFCFTPYISQVKCFESETQLNIDLTCPGRMTFENVTLTAYYPSDEKDDSGEYLDTRSNELKTLQDFLDDNARYVTVSMDEDLKIPYGTLICIPQLNAHYRRRIDLQVRDTASNVKGQGYRRVDICVRSEADSYDHTVNLKNPLTIDSDMMPQKLIRQCLRQFDLLKNVWQTILPDDVYTSSLATLLNEFCIEIIRRVCAIEDIPSSVANGLVDILDVIIDRAPTIFQENQQIMVAVAKWVKLTQLKMILNAPLVQITEQWSEGKGPLTLNYKAEEIKSLIRALFQNTDRRANALSSIK